MTPGWLVPEALDRKALRFSLDRAPAVSRGSVFVALRVAAAAFRYHCTAARPRTRGPLGRSPRPGRRFASPAALSTGQLRGYSPVCRFARSVLSLPP